MFRRALFAFVVTAWTASAYAADVGGSADYERVTVESAKTSIYVGTVTMTMPTFVRANGAYESTYAAKVFPYFFLNESGRIAIEFSADQLGQLVRGEPVEFKGRGVRLDGAERAITGKATPADAKSGKLKVRVRVSKKTELIFNTAYRFEPAATSPPSGK